MKKVLLMSVVTLGTLAATGAAAHAADTFAEATTEANIGLTAPDPTDPTDPIVDPVDPGNGGGTTGQVGPLTLDYASGFGFGDDNEIAAVAKDYDLVQDDAAAKLGFQTTDITGSGAGWNLNVSLGEFKGTTDPTHTLKGATMTFPAASGTLTTKGADASNPPVGTDATLTSDGSANLVMNASTDTGMGTWFDALDANAIKLHVEAGSYADTYKSDITWTLTDGPA